MIYLGSERVITNPFSNHITAEDYAGDHKSIIKIYGIGKVVKVINNFISHENSINYNDYINNKNSWKDGNYYNCISITGKSVRMHYNELGGNQVWIETYNGSEKLILRFAHLDSVNVNVGDIVNQDTIIGLQGNTGLVLSNKSRTDQTYGSHVHLEIINNNGNYINPRDYATGKIVTTYQDQSNTLNSNLEQFKVIVDKINIRQEASELSKDIGEVYNGEVYTILDKVDSDQYIWYKITTNRGLTGYVASKKTENWIQLLYDDTDIIENVEITDEESKEENKNDEYQLIFECKKDDIYYIKLYNGEKLYIKK